jgi:simple sugar transport system ATP-binding protein
MAPTTRIGTRGVTRRFGSVTASDDVTLSVAPGTIHAIIGENGAGKSTLMRMLYGMDRPDGGTVVVDDEAVRLAGPADASGRGIGMVHQELQVIPELTLLENLVVGHEPTRSGGRIDWRAARAAGEALAAEVGVAFDWDSPTHAASIVVRQRLEIVRLLYRQADVLILDEPTAVLAPEQVADLLGLLKRLRDGGRTIVFISHKLHEVREIADTVTTLRGGRVTGTVGPDTPTDELVRLMVGERVSRVRSERQGTRGPVLLQARGLEAVDGRGRTRVHGVDLALHAGEIVGLAGVAGNGQDELVDALVGLRPPTAGTIELTMETARTEITRWSVAARRAAGVAFVPADRRHQGIAPTASVLDNAIAGAHRRPTLARRGFFRRGARRAHAQGIVDGSAVRCGGLDGAVGQLSGGNQQKLILGRELDGDPRVLVVSQPTRGVDVKGAAEIHRRLLAARDRGAALLLVSEELDELTALSDRIVVLADGRVSGGVEGPVDDLTELGHLMTAGGTA